jgi:hypothetical protein
MRGLCQRAEKEFDDRRRDAWIEPVEVALGGI